MTNKNEQRKVPELRFPEFSGEWEEKEIGEVLKIKSGRAYNSNEYLEKGIPVLQGENIQYNNLKPPKLFLPESYLKEGGVVLGEGDVVLGLNRPIIKNYLKISKVDINFSPGLLYQRAGKIFFNSIDNNFGYYLSSKEIKKFVQKESVGSDQPFISTQKLMLWKVFIPKVNEQQKIGEFFSKLDRQIELEEKKLALLEEQKKGYMQKIFSQELRFKDDNGEEYPEWGVNKIEDILIFENNKRKPITSEYRKKGVFPYYGATGQIDYIDGYLFEEKRLLIGEDGANWAKYQKSSFICEGQYWVNNHAHVTYSNYNNIHFIMNILNYMELRSYITGNAPGKLTLDNLKKIKISLPNLKEQNKISDFFKVMDQMIYMGNKKIDKLKLQKDSILKKVII